MSRQLVLNRIKTPDGTTLTSRNRHDYKEYKDANGLTYMIDGGLDYVKRTQHPNAPYEELSVFSDAPHLFIREVFKWGTRGKGGKEPLVFKPIKDLSSDHIQAILDTQYQVPEWRRDIFKNELNYRNGK